VVGADGRDSMMRGWAGFDVRRDPGHTLVAGLLFDHIPVSDDASHAWLNSDLGLWILIFPQGQGRARAYVCYPETAGYRLTGHGDVPRFIEDSIRVGVPAEHYAKAKAAGPLATFDGSASWVDHPYRNGVALIGAAAAGPDPTWGQGLSLTIRDVRALRDNLLSHEDWDEAGHAYAEEHDQYYGVVHNVELWETQVLLHTGPKADARRRKALAAWREDRTRQLDVLLGGPGPTLDEKARRRFFGEE
jgi:2-polyprenyl-6-methoxyphenol hydroxylase-like FAD-dependent oxidoreductase